MVSRLIEIKVETPNQNALDRDPGMPGTAAAPLDHGSLILSISDILLLIDVLIPQPPPNPTTWDPFLNSSATAFAAQYRQGLPPLSKIFPAAHQSESSLSNHSLPINQSSATTLARKFDQVRRDLHAVMDRKDVYPVPRPTQDSWAVLEFDSKGYPVVGRALGGQLTESSGASKIMKSLPKNGHFHQIAYSNLDTVQRAR
jgi:hypothetical protein